MRIMKMNKILIICLIICSYQFANASDTNNNQNIENNNINIINNDINQNDNSQFIKEIRKVKYNRNNVLQFANSNSKCWFVSTFQLFIAALNQSEPDSPLRKTNFAKFVMHLKKLKNDLYYTTYERGERINGVRPNEWDYFNKGTWEIHDITHDRNCKSNIIGGRIDLISELITWGATHNWMYDDTMQNKINAIDENNMTQHEKENKRRNDTLRLLAQIQDMNSISDANTAVSIILNIFPELKQYFGSHIIYNKDILITNTNSITLDNEKRKISVIKKKLKTVELLLDDILEFLPNNKSLNININ